MNGCAGWNRTSNFPGNNRTDYCCPTAQWKWRTRMSCRTGTGARPDGTRIRKNGTPPWCCHTDAWIWRPGCAGWRAACERMQRTKIPTRSSPRRGRAQVRADTLRLGGRRRLRPFISRRGSTPASTKAGPADIFQTPTRTPLHELEIKRPGSCSTTRAMPFQQRTNTVAGGYRCGHGYFTVDVSVFGAHLLRSPSSVETGKLYVGAVAAFWPLQFRPSGRSLVVISF